MHTNQPSWKKKLYEIVFEADTRAGKLFDVFLLCMIVLSTLVVMLESVPALSNRYSSLFIVLEWVFTILFTIECVALLASRHKISVFLLTVLMSVIIAGTLMYLIEGEANGFTSIPISIYWAIVTMTTVGYGDIAPQTALGQALASFIMILGYGIIAVPTGIVSAEMFELKTKEKLTTQVCPHCLKEGHDSDAIHCKFCGAQLNEGR